MGGGRPAEMEAGAGEGPWVCSTWIGLDGLRRWMGSMPQMGTTQSVGQIDSHGYEPNFAWFQWWLRGRGVQEPVPLKDVPIKPGDTVYCAVTRLPRDQPAPGNEHHVQFFLKVTSGRDDTGAGGISDRHQTCIDY